MLVWGGFDNINHLQTGGAYDPATDAWTPITTGGAPFQRRNHTAVWTGTEMVVSGGYGFDGMTDGVFLADGGKYDPATDTWVQLQPNQHPGARRDHTAVWSGTEILVWGGEVNGTYLADGSKYSAQENSWTPMNGPFPEARALHTAVWLSARMIVFGGYNGGYLNSGGIFDPSSNSWEKATPTALTGRFDHTAVAASGKMIVWGGAVPGGFTNTGGVFDPAFMP
jgi:N-acetylneuraminic acid mutarotase